MGKEQNRPNIKVISVPIMLCNRGVHNETTEVSRAYTRNIASGSRFILIEQQHRTQTWIVSRIACEYGWVFEYTPF